jgi:hypothetical protein
LRGIPEFTVDCHWPVIAELARIVVNRDARATFLGFEYRRTLGRNRKWRPYHAPKVKKRTALLAKLKEIFRQNISQPVEWVVEQINPILRGWVNYFAVGDSSECFSFVRNWVEKKISLGDIRCVPGNDQDSGGNGGVGSGSMGSWDCTAITGFADHGHCRTSSQSSRSHNPWWEANR